MYSTNLSKSEVVSLRMPTDRIEQIKKEAWSQKISLNVLANHIFDEYFDFSMYAKNVGYMTLPKKIVSDIVNRLDNEEIAKLAQDSTKSGFIDLVYLVNGKLSLQSFLNIFFAWLRDSHFAYNDQYVDGHHIITVSHNMGQNWSLLLRHFISSVLDDILVKAQFETLNDVLVIHIQESAQGY